MTKDRTSLISFHEGLCERARQLMVRKNQDYGASNDPYRNFRGASVLGVDPAKGILLRMQDKLARLANYIDKGTLAVKEEGVNDTLQDLINYSVLFGGLVESMKPTTPPPALGDRVALDDNPQEIDG